MTEFQKADLDGDGNIDKRELEIYLEAKRREMEDEDAKRDQQRKICLLYTSPSPRDS